MKQLSELEPTQYTPSKPGYRPDDLGGDFDFAACLRDSVRCAWCGQQPNVHGFDLYCLSPRRKDLGLKPY